MVQWLYSQEQGLPSDQYRAPCILIDIGEIKVDA